LVDWQQLGQIQEESSVLVAQLVAMMAVSIKEYLA